MNVPIVAKPRSPIRTNGASVIRTRQQGKRNACHRHHSSSSASSLYETTRSRFVETVHVIFCARVRHGDLAPQIFKPRTIANTTTRRIFGNMHLGRRSANSGRAYRNSLGSIWGFPGELRKAMCSNASNSSVTLIAVAKMALRSSPRPNTDIRKGALPIDLIDARSARTATLVLVSALDFTLPDLALRAVAVRFSNSRRCRPTPSEIRLIEREGVRPPGLRPVREALLDHR